MKKLILPFLIAVLYPLTGNAASLSVDAQGNVINTTPTNFPTGKLKVNGVEVTGGGGGGGPGVTDGDKGDITVSGTGTVWTIDNNVVSLAKLADMATASFLGRNTAGTGDPEVLSISTVKTMLALAIADVSGLQAALDAKLDDSQATAFGLSLLDDANAAAGRATLGGTTVGQNLFTLTNPGAITFLKIAADNTASTRTAAEMRDDLDIEPGTDVATQGHTHTTTTISGIDISDDTNLAVTANEITLTGDTLSLHSAITRDSEWDTAAEINTATTDADFQITNAALAFGGFSSITGRIGNANLPLAAQLFDNAGTPLIAADFGTRQLKRASGTTFMDWEAGTITNATVVNPIIRDSSSLEAIAVTARQLLSSIEVSTLNWNTGELSSPSTESLSANWSTRKLYATDGTTVTLDFTTLAALRTSIGTSTETASTLALRDSNANLTVNNLLGGYVTTATAAGTTTLTVASDRTQYFTGTTTQTVTLPVTSTLTLGHQFVIVNNSTGNVTVNSSGGNAVVILAGGTSTTLTCILTSGTTAASWNSSYSAANVATGKKATINNTLTFSGTDGSTLNIGAGGTLGSAAYTAAGDYATAAHTHTTTTISGLDISDDTNLAGTANEITLTGDTLSAHAALTRDTEWDTAAEINTATTDDDFATLTGAQTLASKTLTSPVINNPTINATVSTGSATFAMDTASGSTLSIPINTTATPFSNANNFSGLIILTSTMDGTSAVFLASGGQCKLIMQSGVNTQFSQTLDNANTTNVYYSSGVITIQNKNSTGLTQTLTVTAIRTRAGS